MNISSSDTVFDYRSLRLLMGIIAFLLPFVVSLIATDPLSSISESYCTEARDAFVGLLFFVSAFLWAYKGHSSNEAVASKVASFAAIFVAVFPTTCKPYEPDIRSAIHYGAAAILFLILAYFCFVPFQKNTKGRKGKKGLRSVIYFICGSVILGSMLTLVSAQLMMPEQIVKTYQITYWAEAFALWSFGIAWMVAGKWICLLVDEDEALKLFG